LSAGRSSPSRAQAAARLSAALHAGRPRPSKRNVRPRHCTAGAEHSPSPRQIRRIDKSLNSLHPMRCERAAGERRNAQAAAEPFSP
jgi:hypothetical protein